MLKACILIPEVTAKVRLFFLNKKIMVITQRNKIDKIELDKMLYNFIDKMKTKDMFLYPVFLLLYYNGLRVGEILELDRWSNCINGYYTIKTEKGSAERQIALCDLPRSFFHVLCLKKQGEVYASYDVVKKRFNTFFNATFCTSDDRRLITHLFRHNFCKKKHSEGMEIEQIAKIIGEKEPRNVYNYVNSEIYKYNHIK